MIIYKNNIKGFIDDATKPSLLVAKIVSSMKEKVGYTVSEKEKDSWKTTLCNSSNLFKEIDNNDKQFIFLEFKIPNAKKRIDIMLIGNDTKDNNLCILELKGWSEINIQDDSSLLSINTRYKEAIHPAYEAEDYQNILSNQFDDINKIFKNIDGIALLPNYKPKGDNALQDFKYEDVLKIIKTYCGNDLIDLIEYLKLRFNNEIDIKCIEQLSSIEYKPSKSFLEHLNSEFNNIILIGSQRFAFEKIKQKIDLAYSTKIKTLITLSGSAGSGKTIVAFKVLGYLVQKGYYAKLKLPGPEFREAIKKQFKQNTISEYIDGASYNKNEDFTIIDEAHKATANGTALQFYNSLFKASNFVITLIDDLQVINKKGITKSELSSLAHEHGFISTSLELEEQFRNGGDSTYSEWLKNWIFDNDNGQTDFIQNNYLFKILDSKDFNNTYKKMYDKNNVRLVSFWTQTWDIYNLDENGFPNRTVNIGDSAYAWNPNWQWLKKIKNNNDTLVISKELNNLCNNMNFINNKKGYEYIAYFNTIQGSEFEYIFVHIPKLFYLNDNNKIDVNLDLLIGSEMKTQIWSLKNKTSEEIIEKTKMNKMYFLNRLFINLTRGTMGTYVYIEDEKLRKYINKKIIRN